MAGAAKRPVRIDRRHFVFFQTERADMGRWGPYGGKIVVNTVQFELFASPIKLFLTQPEALWYKIRMQL